MLIIASFPMPYNYYTLLRISLFIFSSYLLYQLFNSSQNDIKSKIIKLVFFTIAVIFNPFIKIYFSRETWVVIDILIGALFLFMYYKYRK